MSQTESAATPKANPSTNAVKPLKGQRKRIPMSVPQQRLQVPEIPGFHLHWFAERNVPRALAAAYEPVHIDDVPVHQRGVANNGETSGSADLGTGVKIQAGLNELSRPEYLVLMKLPLEFWEEDRREIDAKNAARMGSIFRDEQILDDPANPQRGDDAALRYVKKAVFNRPRRKAEITK